MDYPGIEAIKDLFRNSSDINDLEEHLNEQGHVFKSPTELDKFLHEAWFSANLFPMMKLTKYPITKLQDLPYSEVKRDNVIFKVHGIVHGVESILRGYDLSNQLGPAPIHFVSKKVKKYKNPPGEDYLLEPGFAANFYLDKKREMDCFKVLLIRVGEKRFWDEIQRDVEAAFTPLKPEEIPKQINNEPLKTIIESWDKILVDPDYLPVFRRMYSLAMKLPEPFNLELKLRTGKEFEVYYSEEMSKYMFRYAKDNKLKKLHGVVGFEHESEICYYLSRMS